MTVAEFRAAYPAFASTTVYPDAWITYWLNFAAILVSGRRWVITGLREYGQGLLVAHYLTLADRRGVDGEYIPAMGAAGPATGESQSADGVSWSESRDGSAYKDDGQLAGTWYGQQFLDLRALVGAGGIQL